MNFQSPTNTNHEQYFGNSSHSSGNTTEKQTKKSVIFEESEENENNISTINENQDDELDMEQMEQLLQKQETKLFKLASLREKQCIEFIENGMEKDINIFNVPIKVRNTCNSNQIDNHLEWIHTYECGPDSGPILLILHGYGASSLSFIKQLKKLSSGFKVYCIDILGMGLSSRVQLNFKKPEEIIGYLIESIEQWRKQMNISEKMYIAGHCFGGYLATNYALQYSKRVEKLFLINPIGFSNFSDLELTEIQKKIEKQSGFIAKKCIKWAQKMYSNHETPSSVSKKFYIPSNYLIRKFFQERYNSTKKEAEKYQKYMKRVLQFPVSTDESITYLFRMPNLAAQIPLETEIPKHFKKYPIYSQRTMRSNITLTNTSFSAGKNQTSRSQQISINIMDQAISPSNRQQQQSQSQQQQFQNQQICTQLQENQSFKTNQQKFLSQFDAQQDKYQYQNQTEINKKQKELIQKENDQDSQNQENPKLNTNNNLTNSNHSSSNSDILLQTISNNSILSHKRKQSVLSQQQNQNKNSISSHELLDFQIHFFCCQSPSIVVQPERCQQFLQQHHGIGSYECLEGNHQSILDNEKLAKRFLRLASLLY